MCLHVLPAVWWGLKGLLAVGAHVGSQVAVGGHVAPQTATSGESGVAHQALVGLQARVGPDVSFEDARRCEAPAALHTLERPFSCVGPGSLKNTKMKVNGCSKPDIRPLPVPLLIILTWRAASDGWISCKLCCRTGTCTDDHCPPGTAEKQGEGSGTGWGLLSNIASMWEAFIEKEK